MTSVDGKKAGQDTYRHTAGALGQVSFEFMVVLAALMLIFIVLFAVYFGGDINLFQAQDSVAAMRNSQAVAAALNYVYLAGDGASYNFTLTNTRNDENITLTDYAVTSTRPYASVSAPLLDASVNESSIENGDSMLTNNKGEIDIQRLG